MSIDKNWMLEVLDRTNTGKVVKEKKWNNRIMPQTIMEIVREYDLKGTCDPGNPINQDDELADRYFEAGLAAAEELGMLCTDTHRVVDFSEDEILERIDEAPASFNLGEGKEEVEFKTRDTEDEVQPKMIAPLSIVVSEEDFVPMVEAIASVDEVDVMEGPSLETVWGRELKSGVPHELLSGKYQAELMKEGLERAGREGLGLFAVGSSTTEYGFLGGFGIPNGYNPDKDISLILSPAGVKTSYESLFKLAQTYNAGGENIYAGSWVMLGGYAGGPEGTTVAAIANSLLLYTVYQASNGACFPLDMHYMGNTDGKNQWSLGLTFQALSRNTHLALNSVLNQVNGPSTKALLYETAVGMMNLAVSGATSCTGTRSAGGRLTNHLTPLEIEFAGKVFKSAAGMSRSDANEIAKEIIPKYENGLDNPSDGKSFKECYDLENHQPDEEWKRKYDEVVEEISDLGLTLD